MSEKTPGKLLERQLLKTTDGWRLQHEIVMSQKMSNQICEWLNLVSGKWIPAWVKPLKLDSH